VAITQGRKRFVFAEIGMWRVAIAVVAWFGLVALHPLVFGVPAWQMLVAGLGGSRMSCVGLTVMVLGTWVPFGFTCSRRIKP